MLKSSKIAMILTVLMTLCFTMSAQAQQEPGLACTAPPLETYTVGNQIMLDMAVMTANGVVHTGTLVATPGSSTITVQASPTSDYDGRCLHFLASGYLSIPHFLHNGNSQWLLLRWLPAGEFELADGGAGSGPYGKFVD